MSWDSIEREIRPLGPHRAPTGLIEIENTNNLAGGTVYPLDLLTEICDGAHRLGLPVHMDGARIFNATAALDVPVAAIASKADTVMFCLSKALGAPVGSLLVGPRALIEKGRLYRKRLGGGMRQVGVLAAAGMIALEKMPAVLKQDHANAKLLANGLATLEGITVNPVETNIIIFDIAGLGMTSAVFSEHLRDAGVLANGFGPTTMRMVTHYDVTESMCLEAIEVVKGLHARN
jgi:threonine aldolase